MPFNIHVIYEQLGPTRFYCLGYQQVPGSPKLFEAQRILKDIM